jgi:hypothetical protein
MAHCYKCGVTDETLFYKDKGRWAGTTSLCIACMRVKTKARYAKRDEFLETLRQDGCRSCGNMNMYVIQFHHRYAKDENVRTSGRYPWSKVLDELAKCMPLCANCHVLTHRGMVDVEAFPCYDRAELEKRWQDFLASPSRQ